MVGMNRHLLTLKDEGLGTGDFEICLAANRADRAAADKSEFGWLIQGKLEAGGACI